MYDRNVATDKDSVEQRGNQTAYGRPAGAYERGFDEDCAQNAANTCEECGGRVTMNIHETVCDDCGLVIESGKIDHGPEWTVDENGDSEGRRVGSPNTVARHDRGIGTDIGRARDANGNTIRGRKRNRMGRLRREHSRAKFTSKAERNLMQGFIDIGRMAGALGLDRSVREQACQLFRTAQNEGLLPGRSIEAIASGCVYAACRINELPRTIGEIETVSRVTRARIENGYSVLNQELGLPIPPLCPVQYLPKVASAVDVEAKTERRARELIEAVDESARPGVHPAGVVAGALYQAGRETGDRVTQDELATAAEVSEATVRVRYQEFA
jgi:transcription initiation factor TFIIB